MKRLRVVISPAVLDQIREQVLYIAKDSVGHALAWEERLLAALEGLRDFHGHAIDADAVRRVGGTIRRMVFEKTYLIHYEVNKKAGAVEVLNFRHGSRLPKAHEP